MLNDPARIDKEASGLIENAVRERGATAKVIWADGDPKADENLREADKIIAHADVDQLPPDAGGMLITNRAGKVEFFASGAARYHWGILQLIFDTRK